MPLSEGAFHLDDYVNYVQEFIRHLQSKYGNCHVISVCQPTVPVFAAISLMASRGETTPLSMTMMGGPIDARLSPTSVNNLATTKPYEWFENNVIYRVPSNFAGAGRRVYPGFLQHTGFVAMNPSNHARSHYDYFKDLIKGDDASAEVHRKFYDEYNAVLDMDADYYLETIKTVFQEFKLVNGTWDVMSVKGKAERVKPGDIKTTAVMTVEGELDDISGAGQTRAALDMCSGVSATQKKHFEAKGAGHYGIFSGRRWRDMVYPAVKAFILESNKAVPHKKPALGATALVAKPVVLAIEKPAVKSVAETTAKTAVKATAKSSSKPVVKTLAKTISKAATKTIAKTATAAVNAESAQAPEVSVVPVAPVTQSVNKPAAQPALSVAAAAGEKSITGAATSMLTAAAATPDVKTSTQPRVESTTKPVAKQVSGKTAKVSAKAVRNQ